MWKGKNTEEELKSHRNILRVLGAKGIPSNDSLPKGFVKKLFASGGSGLVAGVALNELIGRHGRKKFREKQLEEKRNDFAITAGTVGTAALLAGLGVEIMSANKKEKEIAKIQRTLRRIERMRRR